MKKSIRLTTLVLFLVAAAIFALVIGRQVYLSGAGEPLPAPELAEFNTYVYDQPKQLVNFNLVDENGDPATRESLRGHWTFAFVGYTHCPDICPAAMANLRLTNQLIGDELPRPHYLLVSADPERDTPEQLKAYTGFFGEDFHGLTGDLEMVRALARSLNAVFVHREVDGEVLVDHSAHFALLNPEGKLVALMQPPHQPKALAQAYRRIVQWDTSNRQRAGG